MLNQVLVWLFKINGWKVKQPEFKEAHHCVLVGAPHTSNWDFVYALAAMRILKIPMRYLIKNSWLKPPFGWFIKPTGAIGVNRSVKTGLVEEVAELFSTHSELALIVTPEGTRKKMPTIKSGFYHMALKADVPIVLSYLDYKNKEAGIGMVLDPKMGYEAVLKAMVAYYSNIPACYPENNTFIGLKP